MYYLTHISDPISFDHSIIDNLLQANDGFLYYFNLCVILSYIELTPDHVYKMSRRLNINLSENKEIDLVWIAYTMLLYPLPEKSYLKQKAITSNNLNYFF